MCLSIYNRKGRKPSPQVAEKDIVVYKILTKRKHSIAKEVTYESPSQYFQYKKGYHYYQEKIKGEGHIDKNGFGIIRDYNNTYLIHQGLHAYMDKRSAERQWHHRGKVIVKMIVPKGSLYYSDYGHIVSNHMIFPHR